MITAQTGIIVGGVGANISNFHEIGLVNSRFLPSFEAFGKVYIMIDIIYDCCKIKKVTVLVLVFMLK